jgi:hypothetical protein
MEKDWMMMGPVDDDKVGRGVQTDLLGGVIGEGERDQRCRKSMLGWEKGRRGDGKMGRWRWMGSS